MCMAGAHKCWFAGKSPYETYPHHQGGGVGGRSLQGRTGPDGAVHATRAILPRSVYETTGFFGVVDALDVRIIRAMGIVPYGSRPKGQDRMKPSSLARAVGTSVNTVKARVAAMERAGVIAGYQIVPNLRHLGLAAQAYRFSAENEEGKDAVVEAMRAVDGILEIHDFLGRHVCADVAFRDEADRAAKVEALLKIAPGEPDPPQFYYRTMPPVDGELSVLDWRILKALRWKANRPLSEVAKEIGASVWTVKRRHDRMAHAGSFFAIPLVDPSKAEGIVPFELLLFLKEGAQKGILAAVLREFNDHAVYTNTPSSPRVGHFFVILFARSTGEVNQLQARARKLPGVERVEAMFFRGLHDESRWLDDAIRERAKSPTPEVSR